MPELPEVETIRLQLDQALKGLRITGVEVLNKKSFIGPPLSRPGGTSEGQGTVGKKVVGVRRRGKIILIELENGNYLAIHLKLTGQLIYRKKETGISEQSEKYCEQKDGPYAVCELPNKFTRVVVSFDPPSPGSAGLRRASKLYFNDLRMFGWIKIITQNAKLKAKNQNLKLKTFLDGIPELEKLGPEANDPEAFTLDYFRKLLAVSHKPVKLIIMDQEKLAGVGNIYANEALFDAGILPTRKGSGLSAEEIKILRDSILSILKEAIKHRGSSDRDEAYRQITGEKGTHQNYLQVYGKAGEKCPRCGRIIKRIALGGRGTFYCEKCQR